MSPKPTSPKTNSAEPGSEPLIRALTGLDLSEARTDFDRLNERFKLIPTTHQAAFNSTWVKILAVAATTGIHDLYDLVARQRPILRDLTGLTNTDKLAQYHCAERAEELHLYRNTIVAITAAAAANFAADVSAVYAHSVKSLKARTVSAHRPLTDDEIVLLRTAAAIVVSRTPTNQPAGVYAQLDIGLTVKETTESTIADLDDPTWPTMIVGLGNRNGLAGRILPLDHFGSTVLAGSSIAAASHGKQSALLTYKPRTNQPGSFAAATSASGVINRFMSEVGLAHTDVTPGSINRWRIRHTWLTDSPHAAEQLSGRDSHTTARLAGMEPISDAPTPFITEF